MSGLLYFECLVSGWSVYSVGKWFRRWRLDCFAGLTLAKSDRRAASGSPTRGGAI